MWMSVEQHLLKDFNDLALEVPCLGSIEIGTFKSEDLRDNVSTSSKHNQEGVYKLRVSHY